MAACVHLGIGCITRIANNKLNIFICIIAAFIPDILFIPLKLLRINGVFWTHSLFMSSVWSIVIGILSYLFYKTLKISFLLFLTSISHWIIDFITWSMSAICPNSHGLPLIWGKTISFGLGLYKSFVAVIITEALFLILSILIIYLLRKKSKKQRVNNCT